MTIAWRQTSISYGGTAETDRGVFHFTMGCVDPRRWWWSAGAEGDVPRSGKASDELEARAACDAALAELTAKPKRKRAAKRSETSNA